MQTRVAKPFGNVATPGLTEGELNELVSELLGPTSGPRFTSPNELDPGEASAILLGVGGTDCDHGILFFRDPKSGQLAVYEPEIMGPAARTFDDDDAMMRYLEERPLQSHPGQIMVIAAA